jgi:hypothetical protein
MRTYVNEPFVQRRAKLGQYLSWAGLGILGVGMVLSFTSRPEDPNYMWRMAGSLACLALGWIAANLGTYNTRRFGRSPRPDQRLEKELKGFDDRYTLYSWMLPSPYVFAGPSGIYAIALREHGGKLTNTGDKWQQPFSLGRMLMAFSNEGVGNPTVDAQNDARKLQQYLSTHIPELSTEVQPLVLFINPRAELELNNPAVPVITPQGLKALLRQRKKDTRLTPEQLQQIEALAAEGST